jgi:FAD/FMN-containing dehydrogenase
VELQAAGFEGDLLTPGDVDYEGARLLRNRRMSRRPAAIARCASVADVQAAVRLARDSGLELAVRGGGHGAAGWASIDDGVVIDLGLIRSVEVDVEARTARIGGGALAIDAITAAGGDPLVPVTGITATVGLGGLLSSLGEGYLTPRHGFGTDHVVELEVVTADGDVIQVSADSDPDLFWAMRGAGTNFGVTTAFTVRLHPRPASVLAGRVVFGPDHVEAVTDYVWDIMRTESIDSWPAAVYTRDETGTPLLSVSVGHLGSPDEAARDVAHLRSIAPALSDDVHEMSYLDLIRRGGGPGADGTPDNGFWDIYAFPFDGDATAQKRRVLDEQTRLHGPGYLALWRTLASPAPEPPNSAPRHAGITTFLGSMWDDPAETAEHDAWGRSTAAALVDSRLVGPAANTINHVDRIDEARIRDLYGAETYARLAALKAIHDPDNVFRSNANIPPAPRS